jgi:two-component system, chemotaxis family, response regulator Rcp1
VAEDSEPDVLLIREALSLAEIPQDRIQVAHDGEKAIRLFEQLEDDVPPVCPDLVLLDINLPKKKGADILRRIRASTKCPATKVLIVTSSDLQRDREQMEQLGANGYFRKPSDYTAFMELGRVVRKLLGLDEVSAGCGMC